MAQNLRQQISEDLVKVLTELEDPRPALVTREPFNVLEIAITQFPAILITATQEQRQTVTMGAVSSGRRTGTINFTIRGYVRGTELDRQRNDLIEAIEEALDSDRYRSLRSEGVMDTQIIEIEIIERMPPLAEILITVQVRYNYLRGTL
jgi:hypothetical protein